MEYIDAFSIFMAGFTVGLIGAHYVNKHENKLAYSRGVMDTIWEIQLHGMREHLTRVLGDAGDKAPRGSNGSNTTL